MQQEKKQFCDRHHSSFEIFAYTRSRARFSLRPDLADTRPQANPPVRPPLPLLRGKNGKALINMRKAENDDIDALKLRPIINSRSLVECPTITALVAAFDAKAFSDTELLKSFLAGGNRIINFCRQTNRKQG